MKFYRTRCSPETCKEESEECLLLRDGERSNTHDNGALLYLWAR